jgi:hypothetical protein
MAQLQTGCTVLGENAEPLPDALPGPARSLRNGRFLYGMDANAFRRTVIEGGEDRYRTSPQS